MLILTRKRGESIYIGGRIKVTVVELKGNQVRIGIEAPQEERVYREEIYLQILEENKQAAEATTEASIGLDGLTGLAEVWEGKGIGPKKEATGLQGLGKSRISSVSKASVGGQEVPVFKKRKRDTQSDE